MKKYAAKFLCIVVFLSTWGSFKTLQAQSDYSVPLTFSVSATGINRFISSQWGSIQSSWSGTYQGLNYSFTLEKPTVSLSTNTIKIMLGLSINSSVYNGKVTLTPSLTIPSTTINFREIITKYTNLHEQIIGTAQLADSRLRQAIEDALSPIDWVVYKGKVIASANDRLSETADIRYKGIPELTFSVSDNELNFLITPVISAIPPNYSIEWMKSDKQHFGIRILSNDKFTIEANQIDKIYDLRGREFNFTVDSSFPIQATYDTDLQKYVAGYNFHSDGDIASQNIWGKIYIKRGGTPKSSGMTTIWSFGLSVLDVTHSWTVDRTKFNAIRGE